jgi:hypothetical protein
VRFNWRLAIIVVFLAAFWVGVAALAWRLVG